VSEVEDPSVAILRLSKLGPTQTLPDLLNLWEVVVVALSRALGSCEVAVGGLVVGTTSSAGAAKDHVWFEYRWMVASLCDE
jgi:hypothetical protein